MVTEVAAKGILSRTKDPGNWFGVLYNLNVYRGCQHACIYCDSRSQCYGIEDFDNITVKVNAVDLLRKELASKRCVGTVGTGSMSDPYIPLEQRYRLTRRVLETVAEFRFPVHISTKGDLVTRDLDVLQSISRVYASVAFTVTTCDESLAARVEPFAPPPGRRLKAMEALARNGIYAGILMMPVLPFIEDNLDNVREVVNRAAAHGASFIYPWMGMTLRDRQRDYYYRKVESLFPGLPDKYRKEYGDSYGCDSPASKQLSEAFAELCQRKGLVYTMKDIKKYESGSNLKQLGLI